MRLLVSLLLLCAAIAQAQPICPREPTCDPHTQPDRTKCGSDLGAREQLPSGQLGEWRAWWFPVGTAPGGVTWWCRFKWAALDKHAPKTAAELWAISSNITAAPSLAIGIMEAMQSKSVKPPAGSLDAYEFELLHYRACLALIAAPPTVWGPGQAPTCTAPVPQAAPVYTHAVKPNATSTTRPAYILANGVRGTKEVGRATVGQPCDLTKPTLASGADVWAEFGPDFVVGVVALCGKKP